jgi:hypothetical protein
LAAEIEKNTNLTNELTYNNQKYDDKINDLKYKYKKELSNKCELEKIIERYKNKKNKYMNDVN